MSLRKLGRQELALLRLYTSCKFQISPMEFYSRWEVSHRQLGELCGCSEATVNRWFSGTKNYHAPAPVYMRRLAEIDLLLECWNEIPLELRRRVCHFRESDGEL